MSSNNFQELDTFITKTCVERQLWELGREWRQVKKDLLNLEEKDKQILALQQQFEAVDKGASKLLEPPLHYAVYLGRSPGTERDLIVGMGNSRLEVRVNDDLLPLIETLQLGQLVLLNEKHNVVAIRNDYTVGETAEVVNIITPSNEAKVIRVIEDEKPAKVVILWHESEEMILTCNEVLDRANIQPGHIVQVDEKKKLALPRTKPRLHVKASGNEGTVVEITDRLYKQDEQGIKIGDIVRIEPGLKFAFEKLPAYETGELTLEEVPDVTYEDIGGLDTQIGEIYDAIELPYLHKDMFKRYQLNRPKGILLYGPPGCGKTMVAKAVANSLTYNIRSYLENQHHLIVLYQQLRANPDDPQLLEEATTFLGITEGSTTSEATLQGLEQRLELFDISLTRLEEKKEEIRAVLDKKDGVRSFFLNVKGPELLDKYVGETEHRIRKIFEVAGARASYYTPVVIFFDEMEAMFRTRGTGRSSDIETTIVPQFLSELDGVESTSDLVIIGASNRQDMIDPAILRPKRLDVKIKIDRPSRKAAEDIFTMYLLPTLPLNPAGIKLPTVLNKPGACVFRTAYPAYYPLDNTQGRRTATDSDTAGFLPLSCDFRLALSLSPEELDEIARQIPAKMTIREALTLEQLNIPWDKLRRFRSTLEVHSVIQCLRSLRQRMEEDATFCKTTQHLMRQEWIAEGLVLHAAELLYGSLSMVHALTSRGINYAFLIKDFMSGAIIANIADRAKKLAIKRTLIAQSSSQEGIGLHDIEEALDQEFEENKEQLALHKLHHEMGQREEEILSVQVFFETQDNDPWSEEKLPLYKTNYARG